MDPSLKRNKQSKSSGATDAEPTTKQTGTTTLSETRSLPPRDQSADQKNSQEVSEEEITVMFRKDHGGGRGDGWTSMGT